MTAKKETYQKLLEAKKQVSKSCNLKSEPLQKSLENLKKENERNLEKRKLNLMTKQNDFKNQFVKNLLKNSETPPPNYPKDLSLYWKHNDWDAITKLLNAKNNTIRGHETFLIRELGKKNKTLEWFFETFDNEIIGV